MSSDDLWNKSSFEVSISGSVARATKDFKRALSAENDGDLCSPSHGVNSQSIHAPLFPWVCPTAVSEASFEDGLHEFVVEVMSSRGHVFLMSSSGSFQPFYGQAPSNHCDSNFLFLVLKLRLEVEEILASVTLPS